MPDVVAELAIRRSGSDQMNTLLRETVEMVEDRVVRVGNHAITFDEFIGLSGENDDLDLVDGIMVKRMSAQLEHERLFVWLQFQLNGYVRHRGLGIVLGSRTAVEINPFGGRLPDILFVRSERSVIVQKKAIYGAPDLVIELVSPNDRPGDVVALETDYRTLGVGEIVFIEPSRRRVRILRSNHDKRDPTEYA